MTPPRLKRFAVRLLPLAAVGAALLLNSAGCEQRVVRTENSWVGSQLDGVEVEPVNSRRQQNKDGLAGVGEFLFGWMDGGEGEEEDRFQSVDFNDRMSQPQTRQSGRGQ